MTSSYSFQSKEEEEEEEQDDGEEEERRHLYSALNGQHYRGMETMRHQRCDIKKRSDI